MRNRSSSKKVINSIGIGLMAFLASGTPLLQITASASELDGVGDGGTQENEPQESGDQSTPASEVREPVSESVNEAKETVTEAKDSGSVSEDQATEITGALDNADSATGDAQEKVDTMNAVSYTHLTLPTSVFV